LVRTADSVMSARTSSRALRPTTSYIQIQVRQSRFVKDSSARRFPT
jgi:hypothetical protein